MQTTTWSVATFYRFLPLQSIETEKTFWERTAQELGVDGLAILANEGFNTTLSSTRLEALQKLVAEVKSHYGLDELFVKWSASQVPPFHQFKVRVRPEICTLGVPHLVPPVQHPRSLSPDDWEKALQEPGVKIVDTRNWYEVKMGTFVGAMDPKIEQFTEFPERLPELGVQPQDKVLIFCTGGIRCEKAILDLEQRGYKNVYQLEGGILNYLEQKPNSKFVGECFVFDGRVAVDQNLAPTQIYKLCPHCGQPGQTRIECSWCDTPVVVCDHCLSTSAHHHSCSKNCAHQLERHPGKKGRRQECSKAQL